jgi:hypothetical protein
VQAPKLGDSLAGDYMHLEGWLSQNEILSMLQVNGCSAFGFRSMDSPASRTSRGEPRPLPPHPQGSPSSPSICGQDGF